jgi:hypothetical protein
MGTKGLFVEIVKIREDLLPGATNHMRLKTLACEDQK